MKNIASLTLQRDLHYAKNGIANCLISGITWGIDAILLGYLLTNYPFNDTNTAMQAPLIAACIHTGFSSFFILLYNFYTGKIKEFGRCLFSKAGILIIICAICSGPLAMSGYLLGINMAGASYAAVITSSYPAIGTVLAVIFLKEKLNKRTLIGILLCVVGAIATGYMSPTNILYPKFYLGIIFAFIAALGWGLEGVFGAYVMDIVDPEIAISVRQTASFFMYIFCVIPFIKGFKILFNSFTASNMIILILAGILCSVSYITWYFGLSMTGVGRAMALNITYPLWVIILEWLITGVQASPNLIIGCLIIVFGAILVSGNPKEMLRLREYKE
ncbi:DMT family transporter [Clostridium ganghwense]|uniref:EamA family transporter n=1 Tax=Clostridium ganghwense TaxID=312089 RepID=A0ABT4CRQ1_9CLOT|nr:EamA family transporter [Clostridium ganghwense]MCY6371745.1 EamA family transporter [Clostridium ganghwense]